MLPLFSSSLCTTYEPPHRHSVKYSFVTKHVKTVYLKALVNKYGHTLEGSCEVLE